MRRAIETAPRNGKAILLENDASGDYVVARWSAEADDWVAESGESIRIMATHWYAMPPASWARRHDVLAFSSNRAAPQQPKASDSTPLVNATPVDAIGAWAVPGEDRRVPDVRRRVAALLTIATLIAALLGVSFGIPGGPAIVRAPLSQAEVPPQAASLAREIVPQRLTDSDRPHLPAAAQTIGLATQSLTREQRPEAPSDELARAQRTIRELNLQLRERASELAIARREIEMHASQSSKSASEKAQLKQAADITAAQVRELANQLARARSEIEAHAAPARDASDEVAEIRRAAENATTELLRSLRQERDRAEALARDLAAARREIDAHATLARDANAEAAQARQTSESTAAELRQSLRQERDRAEALATELTSARREIDTHAKVSSKATTEAKHIKRVLRQKRDKPETLARDIELDPALLFRGFRLSPW